MAWQQPVFLDETLIQEGDFTVETAQKCALRLLSLPEPPTAIFAANDMSAMAFTRLPNRWACASLRIFR
jgi:DNA-binding LacI/PurR family transcriptional regulator